MNNLYQATIIHRTKGRIRIKFDPAANKQAFFEQLETTLKKEFSSLTVRINPKTRSVVLNGDLIDENAVKQMGLDRQLYEIKEKAPFAKNRVISHSKSVFSWVDKTIQRFTGGQIDMSGSVFIVLIVHVMREIAKGNLTTPSWFNALRFASTLYTRDFNGGTGEGDGHDDGGHDV